MPEHFQKYPPGVELGGFKGLRFWNIIMRWNEEIHF